MKHKYKFTMEFELDKPLTEEVRAVLELDLVSQLDSLCDGTYEEDYKFPETNTVAPAKAELSAVDA